MTTGYVQSRGWRYFTEEAKPSHLSELLDDWISIPLPLGHWAMVTLRDNRLGGPGACSLGYARLQMWVSLQ